MALRHVRRRTWIIVIIAAAVLGSAVTLGVRHYLAGLKAHTVYLNAISSANDWVPQGELVNDEDFVSGAMRNVSSVQGVLFAGQAYGPGGAEAVPTVVLLTSEEKFSPWAHKVLTLWKSGRSWQVTESGLWSSRNPVMTLPVRPASLTYPDDRGGTVVQLSKGVQAASVGGLDGTFRSLELQGQLAYVPAAAGGDRAECLVYSLEGAQLTSPGMEAPIDPGSATGATHAVHALQTARGCTRGVAGSSELAIGADEPVSVQYRGRVNLPDGAVDAFSVRRFTYETSTGTVLLAGDDGVMVPKPRPWAGYAADIPPLAVTMTGAGPRPDYVVVDSGSVAALPDLQHWSGGDTTVFEGSPPLAIVTLDGNGTPLTTTMVTKN